MSHKTTVVTTDPSTWPEQLNLPGQSHTADGPHDQIGMFAMHHGFRRDLDRFVAAAEYTSNARLSTPCSRIRSSVAVTSPPFSFSLSLDTASLCSFPWFAMFPLLQLLKTSPVPTIADVRRKSRRVFREFMCCPSRPRFRQSSNSSPTSSRTFTLAVANAFRPRGVAR